MAEMWGATISLLAVMPSASPKLSLIAFLVGSAWALVALLYVYWLWLFWQASFKLEEQPNTRRQRDEIAGVSRCRESTSGNYLLFIAELERLTFEYENRKTRAPHDLSAASSIQRKERVSIS
jgi:hypothetical protein